MCICSSVCVLYGLSLNCNVIHRFTLYYITWIKFLCSYLLQYGITVDASSSNNYARVSHTSYNLWHAQVVYFCSQLLCISPSPQLAFMMLHGPAFTLGPNPVSWWSKKQTLVQHTPVPRRSIGVQLISQQKCSKFIHFLILTKLECKFKTPKILCDNLCTVYLAHYPILHSRTKHMEFDIF